MTAYECPPCEDTGVVTIPDALLPGRTMTIDCRSCSDYGRRVSRMLGDLDDAMRRTPPLPRGPLQSSEEIAHEMALEQHAEEIHDGAYDYCQNDPARDDRDADREARWAS